MFDLALFLHSLSGTITLIMIRYASVMSL